MLFEDRNGRAASFAKDPCVLFFGGRYFLYYSRPLPESQDFCIGIAVSDDLTHFEPCGEICSQQRAEGRGVCAPGGIVLNGVIHLFYQSYGQFPKDYICHATSTDGLHFQRDPSNPIICPRGDWNCGRAIDADVVVFGDRLLLYWATRDPQLKTQMLGVSAAPLSGDFSAACWKQLNPDFSILAPELSWEQQCIEAPAALCRNGKIYLFYGGAYNCCPQQIGAAVSSDGVHFTRLFQTPFLPNGPEGSWNQDESGHPFVFEENGRYHLFYQGSNDHGKTWRLSRLRLDFDENDLPCICKP